MKQKTVVIGCNTCGWQFKTTEQHLPRETITTPYGPSLEVIRTDTMLCIHCLTPLDVVIKAN